MINKIVIEYLKLNDEEVLGSLLHEVSVNQRVLGSSPRGGAKRWYRLVKQCDNIKDKNDNILKITADFYSLKHSLLDSLPLEISQKMANHTTSKTTSIYRVNQSKRDREELKKITI